jgi:hypothetical protein
MLSPATLATLATRSPVSAPHARARVEGYTGIASQASQTTLAVGCSGCRRSPRPPQRSQPPYPPCAAERTRIAARQRRPRRAGRERDHTRSNGAPMGAATMTEVKPATDKTPPRKVAQPRQISARITLEIQPSELCATLGVTDPGVAARLLSQLLEVLQPDSSEPVDPALINQALGFIRGIGPKTPPRQ